MVEPLNIIRVFPQRTSHMPRDEMAFVGDPPLFRPKADEVHISVCFTWDIKEGRRLQEAWADHYEVVKLGGPPITGSRDDFIPGRYTKEGVIHSSRGCPYHCPWCLVPEWEGDLRLLPIQEGHIIQDNNILATPRWHQAQIYEMLSGQKERALFTGGIDARLVDGWVADQLQRLRISSIFMAADTMQSLRSLGEAVRRLSFLGRDKLRCYVLIGFGDEDINDAELRLRKVWEIGCLPFAQLYRPPEDDIEWSREWRQLARTWSRPAAMKAVMKG